MTHRLCLVMPAKAGIHDFLFKMLRATKSQNLRRLVLQQQS
jgi:hypothetical protein